MFYNIIVGMTRPQKQVVFSLIDAAMIGVSILAAIFLGTQMPLNPAMIESEGWLILALMTGGAGLSWWFGLPRIKLNAYEMRGVIRTAAFACTLGALGSLAVLVMPSQVPPRVFFIFSLMVLLLSATWRIALRQVTIQIYRRGNPRMRVLIYGAGQTGQQLVAALRHDDAVQAIAFIDDNPTLQSLTISGLRVYAPSSVKELIHQKNIDRVVLAMPSISQPAIARIAHRLRNIGCEVHALPSFAALVGEGELKQRVAPVSLDDLLGRNRLEKELPGVSHAYSGRHIMVTGAGGSIGSELCRR